MHARQRKTGCAGSALCAALLSTGDPYSIQTTNFLLNINHNAVYSIQATQHWLLKTEPNTLGPDPLTWKVSWLPAQMISPAGSIARDTNWTGLGVVRVRKLRYRTCRGCWRGGAKQGQMPRVAGGAKQARVQESWAGD